MKEARECDIAEVLEFLKNNIADSIYMYIDIKKYGLSNPNMAVWIDRDQKNNQLKAVVMKYYDSMQIFSDSSDWNTEWLREKMLKEDVSMVSGREDLIQELAAVLGSRYNSAFGMVYQLKSYRQFDGLEEVEHATLEDMEEIARLICTDEAFQVNYQVKKLEQQLRERMSSGMGRSVVIRKNGRIIAHIATYAEFENIVVTSGLIVHPDYRKGSYGFIIESFLVNELLQESKDVYTFILEPKRAALMNAMGADLCGRYGKLTLNK